MKYKIAKFNIEVVLGNALLYLKLKRNSGFIINDCYFYGYNWDDTDTYIYIAVELVGEDVLDKIDESIALFNFFISDPNNTVKFELQHIWDYECESIEKFIEEKIEFGQSRNHTNISKLNNKLNEIIDSEKEKFISICKYYDSAIYLFSLKMYAESFLNAFKAIELIAEDYYEKNKENIKQEIKDDAEDVVRNLVTKYYKEDYEHKMHSRITNNLTKQILTMGLRQKIKRLINGVIDKDIVKRVDDIVLTRNKVVAHGNSTDLPENIKEHIIYLSEVTRVIAPLYFLKENHKYFQITINRKDTASNFTVKPTKKMLMGYLK